MMTYKKFSEPGNREINEDCVGLGEKGSTLFCVLCDGLGGHGRGEEASALVVGEMLKFFNDSPDIINNLSACFEDSQKKLLAAQKENGAKFEMKTTACTLVITDKEIGWAHIGDSRVYLFKKGKYKKRTLDHSVPQMLVMAKDIKEKDIRNHPDRNKLLRVMGIEWGASSYTVAKKIRRKDYYAFLLCSDGFWELIEEDTMSQLLRESKDANEWVEKMAEVVRENGKEKNMDNFSAVAVIL